MTLQRMALLLGGLAVASPLTRLYTPDRVLAHTTSVSRRLLRRRRPWDVEGDERVLMRASRVIFGSNCLDRAVVLRCVGAWHGMQGCVVIGFRSKGASRGFEGHAWVEWEDGRRSFVHDADQYTPVHREGS